MCEIIKAAIPAKMRAGTGHPAKQTFQAQRLKRQMYAEKSMRKQMEVKKDYQAVLKQIQELK